MAAPASVEEYLAGLGEPQRARLEELRATILAAAPGATESISYQVPAVRIDGRILVYYAAFRDHLSLFPASGAAIEALGDEGRRHATGKGTLRFSLGEPLPVELVRRVVAFRLAESGAARSGRPADGPGPRGP